MSIFASPDEYEYNLYTMRDMWGGVSDKNESQDKVSSIGQSSITQSLSKLLNFFKPQSKKKEQKLENMEDIFDPSDFVPSDEAAALANNCLADNPEVLGYTIKTRSGGEVVWERLSSEDERALREEVGMTIAQEISNLTW